MCPIHLVFFYPFSVITIKTELYKKKVTSLIQEEDIRINNNFKKRSMIKEYKIGELTEKQFFSDK